MRACQEEITRLEVNDNVTLVTDFLSDAEALERLNAANIIVYPCRPREPVVECRW